ncbi:MAG: peptidyl-tRNA hydrolase Pth2 [Nitrososphaeraceae archaeon]|jgi:peptidyl-tRNA hydrolase, PTH2 family
MYKQVIIVRKDLGMSCGKIAAQVAHAAIMAMERASKYDMQGVIDWKEEDGQIKVILKVNSYSELNDYFINIINANLPVVKIHDAGRTQLEPDTVTCIGIGPVPSERIDPIVKDLKLL